MGRIEFWSPWKRNLPIRARGIRKGNTGTFSWSKAWSPFRFKSKRPTSISKPLKNLPGSAYQSILRYRYQLEQYILSHPDFLRSLVPLAEDEFAPPIVRRMIRAAQGAGVGPMAAVAGAMAEAVGQDLLRESPEVIVENGGDIFLRSSKEVRVGIFAGSLSLEFPNRV